MDLHFRQSQFLSDFQTILIHVSSICGPCFTHFWSMLKDGQVIETWALRHLVDRGEKTPKRTSFRNVEGSSWFWSVYSKTMFYPSWMPRCREQGRGKMLFFGGVPGFPGWPPWDLKTNWTAGGYGMINTNSMSLFVFFCQKVGVLSLPFCLTTSVQCTGMYWV